MAKLMVEEFSISDFGCVRDLTLKLSPLHALIGPNDSGKSTILSALRTLAMATTGTLVGEDWGDVLKRVGRNDASLRATTNGWSVCLKLSARGHAQVQAINPGGGIELSTSLQSPLGELDQKFGKQMSTVRGAQLLRLDPDALRMSTALIPDGHSLGFLNERGLGLPSVYDAIQNRNLERFVTINEQVKRLFPTVARLQLRNPTADRKALAVELVSGETVHAKHMSEGLLYFLAFAAIGSLAPKALILVEEPENGLHPARIREVMTLLREISTTTQVIVATHSPLVVNELHGNEVSIITRKATEGTKATLLADTPKFAERAKIYALGELWVSYADGESESALLKGPDGEH